MTTAKSPVALIIMDGWGYRENPENNAIAAANTPNLDRLSKEYTATLISGSGLDVGLPEGQMGNSEVGHVNLGAGRVVYQDFTRISKAISDGDFFTNEVLAQAVETAKANNGAVHIMGLLSDGGVHSHQEHIEAAVKLAAEKGVNHVHVHGFLDGRDTPPDSAASYIEQMQSYCDKFDNVSFSSIVGRYYAMDRDNRWDRIELAYNMLTQGIAEIKVKAMSEGIQLSYQADVLDEFVKPVVLEDYTGMNKNDAVLFMNFRADRARQLSHAFATESFDGFSRNVWHNNHFVMLTEYESTLNVPCAFPTENLVNVLGEWLSKNDKTQLRISETEKFAHVTFFFSGGKEDEYEGEKRILIPSPDVATYDLQPEMNSEKLTDDLVAAILSKEFDVIVCNYPNGDMVGHTGNFDAAVKACEAVDRSIGRVVDAIQQVGGDCLITADHGNAEQMVDPNTGGRHTAHTSEPVPFIHVGRKSNAREKGTLSDVAPTILHLMDMPQPDEMTGSPIVTLVK